MTRIFARKSGNKEVSYRWAGEVGSGRLVRAQEHPAATTTADDVDTWSDNVDARVTRRTPVRLPAGTARGVRRLGIVVDLQGLTSTTPGSWRCAGVICLGWASLSLRSVAHTQDLRTVQNHGTCSC